MRRLLVIGFLFCSGTIAAQTDSRGVRTVEIDEGQVRAGPANDRRVRAPERAMQSDERADGAEHPDEHMVLARQLVAIEGDVRPRAEVSFPRQRD